MEKIHQKRTTLPIHCTLDALSLTQRHKTKSARYDTEN